MAGRQSWQPPGPAPAGGTRGLLVPAGGLQEPDKPGLSRPVVPDEHVVTGLDVSLEELVRGDRAVGQIGLGQPLALLEPPKIILNRRDQGDRDALDPARPRPAGGRARAQVGYLLRGQRPVRCESHGAQQLITAAYASFL